MDITATNTQGVTVTAHAVNLNRTGWGFTATDASGCRVRFGSAVLLTGLSEADAERHARYVANQLGDVGTHVERRRARQSHRYPY